MSAAEGAALGAGGAVAGGVGGVWRGWQVRYTVDICCTGLRAYYLGAFANGLSFYPLHSFVSLLTSLLIWRCESRVVALLYMVQDDSVFSYLIHQLKNLLADVL